MDNYVGHICKNSEKDCGKLHQYFLYPRLIIYQTISHTLRVLMRNGSCFLHTLNSDRRWGELGVYRILSASALFHTLMALILIGVKSSRDGRSIIQKG